MANEEYHSAGRAISILPIKYDYSIHIIVAPSGKPQMIGELLQRFHVAPQFSATVQGQAWPMLAMLAPWFAASEALFRLLAILFLRETVAGPVGVYLGAVHLLLSASTARRRTLFIWVALERECILAME